LVAAELLLSDPMLSLLLLGTVLAEGARPSAAAFSAYFFCSSKMAFSSL
jgi:hypothetical protein